MTNTIIKPLLLLLLLHLYAPNTNGGRDHRTTTATTHASTHTDTHTDTHTHKCEYDTHINCRIYENGRRFPTTSSMIYGLWSSGQKASTLPSINNLKMQCKTNRKWRKWRSGETEKLRPVWGGIYLTDIYPGARQRQVSFHRPLRCTVICLSILKSDFMDFHFVWLCADFQLKSLSPLPLC